MYPDSVMEPNDDGPFEYEPLSVEEHREMLGCEKCHRREKCSQTDGQFELCHEAQAMDELYYGGK